jgi:hypothetical protein
MDNSSIDSIILKPRKIRSAIDLEEPKKNTEIIKTVDCDAVFGAFEFHKFARNFFCNISIQLYQSTSRIDNKPDKILSNLLTENSEGWNKINSFYHYRIGTATTNLGKFSLFIVFTGVNIVNNKRTNKTIFDFFLELIKNAGTKMNSCQNIKICKSDLRGSFIEGNLIMTDFEYFFDAFHSKFGSRDPLVYLETFGNKVETSTGYSKREFIYQQIKNLFGATLLEDLWIDLCISNSAGTNRITFAKKSLFEDLDIKPNYRPCMADAILNYNSTTVSSKDGTLTKEGLLFKLTKLNFYSSFKRDLDFTDSSLYKAPITSAIILSKLHGCRIQGTSNRLNRLTKKYENVYQDYYMGCASKTYPYRMEFRLKFEDIDNFFAVTEKYFDNKYFHSCLS